MKPLAPVTVKVVTHFPAEIYTLWLWENPQRSGENMRATIYEMLSDKHPNRDFTIWGIWKWHHLSTDVDRLPRQYAIWRHP